MADGSQRGWALARGAFFALVVPGTVLYLIPHWAGAFRQRRPVLWQSPAWPLMLIGAALVLYCIFEFAWTGLGTLAIIDPPRNLVARGPYRYVRNPMYLGVLTFLLGEAVLFRSSFLPRYWLLALVFFVLFVRLYEEPVLRRKFGADYLNYCATVPQWFPRRARKAPTLSSPSLPGRQTGPA